MRLSAKGQHCFLISSSFVVMLNRAELCAWGYADSDERSRSPSPVLSTQDAPSLTPPSSRSSMDERTIRDTSRWSERSPSSTQPSRDVILLGLDADVNAEMMRTLVTVLANMVDARLAPPPQDVTVIRDRNNGTSKGFGFVKFNTLEDAKRFVYLHAPFISNPDTWLGPVKHTGQRRKRIKIDFSNSERPQGGLSYYEQHNAPDSKDQLKKARARRAKMMAGAGLAAQQMDMANENAGLRDAAVFPTDMLLLTNVRCSETAASIGAVLCQASSAIEQVLLLRNRSTQESTGRVFIVLRDSDAAKAMLNVLRDRQKDYLSLLGEGVKTSYADAIVMEEADPFDPTNAAYVYEDRRGRTWRYEDESLGLEIWKPEDMLPTGVPSSACSSVSEAHTPPPAHAPHVSHAPPVATTAPEPIVSHGTTYFVTQPVAMAPKPPPMSQHAILRMLNFCDASRRICVLCQRQFRSMEMLHRHTEESALHQANLNDETACRAGAARMLSMPSNVKENETASPSPPPTMVPPMVEKNEAKVLATRPALQQVGWNASSTQAWSMPSFSIPIVASSWRAM